MKNQKQFMIRSLYCAILAVVLVLCMMPAMAFADDGAEPVAIKASDCTMIGTYGTTDVYYTTVPEGTESIVFSELEADGAMIFSNYGNELDDTMTVPVSGDWRIPKAEAETKIKLKEGVEAPDYTNVYLYYVMDGDGESYVFLIGGPAAEIVIPDVSFTAAAGETALENITKEEDAYSYYNYYSGTMETVDVYTIEIPFGVSSVDLTFSEKVLAYNYTSDGTYIGGYYTNFMEGAETGSVKVNGNLESSGEEGTQYYVPADTEFDVVQVQTPYDENYNSTLLYGITFKYAEPEELETVVSQADIAAGKQAVLPENYTWEYYPATIRPGEVNKGTASYTDPAVGIKVGDIKVNITAAKDTQPMTVTGKTAKVKYAKLKKKAQKLAVGKVLTVKKQEGKVTYVKKSGNKKITIAKKTGKVTVKKGLKKGTYKVRVAVTAAGSEGFEAGTKTETFKIKVS